MTGLARDQVAPILVLALGNLLLADDGVGLRVMERVADGAAFDEIEYLDGGTQGVALLPYLAGRSALLVLDAVGLGQRPGTVHVLRGGQIGELRARRPSTAHEGNALEMLETARLLGYDIAQVAVVGVEPARICTGIGLSPEVESSVEEAATQARRILCDMVDHVSCNSR